MQKRKILVLFLFVMPLLAVLVATNPTGVMVFDGETTTYYSWLHLVADSAVGWCAPFAALLNYAVFGLAVIYGLMKKEWCIKAIRNIAAVAGLLAVVPNLVQADVMVVPNVFGAIALFVDAVAAELLLRDVTITQKKVHAPERLNRR